MLLWGKHVGRRRQTIPYHLKVTLLVEPTFILTTDYS